MTGFMGPPWQLDWTEEARLYRDSLPPETREKIVEARTELVTAEDPYFRGVRTGNILPPGMAVEPARSSRPKGPRILHFDHGRGWMRYTFIARAAEPQIVVEELFWQ